MRVEGVREMSKSDGLALGEWTADDQLERHRALLLEEALRIKDELLEALRQREAALRSELALARAVVGAAKDAGRLSGECYAYPESLFMCAVKRLNDALRAYDAAVKGGGE
jgi:hypothetical protein